MRSLLAVLAVLAVSSAARADVFYQFALNSATNTPITTHNMNVNDSVSFDVYVVATNGPNTNDLAKFQSPNSILAAGVRLMTPNTGIVGMLPVADQWVEGQPYFGLGLSNYFNVITPNSKWYDPDGSGQVGTINGRFVDNGGNIVQPPDNVPTLLNAQINMSPLGANPDYSSVTAANRRTATGRYLIGTFTYTALAAGTGTLTTSDIPGTTVGWGPGSTANELDSVIAQASVFITVVPEPSSMALCGAMAIAGGIGYYRRRKQAVAA